ncbi:hypothetical protein TSAR_001148, partial [Trichomalopsis sarcophagae]
FEWAFGLNRICLNFIGVWPNEVDANAARVKDSSIKYLRIPAMLILILVGLIVPQMYAITKVYKRLQLVLDNLTLSYCTITSFIKLFFLWKSRGVYGPMLRSALLDWQSSQGSLWEYEIMRKQARRAQIFTLSGYIVMLFSFIVFIIFPIFGLSIRIINNITDTAGEDRFLPIQTYYPFDVNRSPYFEMIFVSHVIICSGAASCFSIPDYFFGALVFHASAQCEILAVKVQQLFPPQVEAGISNTFLENKFFRTKIKQLVQRHVHLISFVETIESSFNLIILAQTICLTLIICCLGFNIIMEKQINYFQKHNEQKYYSQSLGTESNDSPILPVVSLGGSTLTILMHMLVYCFASEILAMHSEGISEAAYDCDWYTLPVNCAREIIPIMVRASYPLKLSAGKFFYLSLNAFLSIVKTSFGYVSVLLALAPERSESAERRVKLNHLSQECRIEFYRTFLIKVVLIYTVRLAHECDKHDFEWAFSLNRICLKAVGVWPSELDELDTRGVSNNRNHLRIPIMLFTMWFGLITPQLYALAKVYRQLQLVLDNLTLTYCTFTSFIKLCFLWRSRRESCPTVYGPILRSALIDWSGSRSSDWKYETMYKQAYRAQIFTLGGYLVMTFSFACFMFFPFFGLSIRIINNITDPGGEYRFLPIQAHYPFRYDRSPYFEITYATQMLIGCCAASTFTIPDYFFGALVFHASAQCEILAAGIRELCLEELDTSSTEKPRELGIFRTRLRHIVRRHVHLIRFVNNIEKSFNMVILAQTLNLATENNSESLPILPIVTLGGSTITMMCHMLVYCFASEVLAMHSESIGTACYGSDWHLLTADCARNVIPIIARAQHPLQLSAGKFFYLSLNAFLSVVKTSFGYVSVLLAVGA